MTEAVLISIVILIVSAILHEIAHGYVAEKLGDPTARLAGRLTLNPIPHIDPMMSILVPIMLIVLHSPIIFGGAKPVPVNPLMLREGRKDLALVALAGPLTNLLIACLAAIFIRILGPSFIMIKVIEYNLILGFLNLIPIPPLDGSKFFSFILPQDLVQKYYSLAPFGVFALFALLLLTPLGDILYALVVNSMRLLGIV